MYILGLHPDGDYFKVALLSRNGRKLKINLLSEYKKDILDLNKLKRTLVSETSFRDDSIGVASALSIEDVFVRSSNLPITNRKSVEKALPYRSEFALFYQSSEITVVSYYERKKKGTKVTLYGYRDEAMEAHIQNLKTLGFDPDWVSTSAHALMRFSEAFVSEAASHLVLHFGWETSLLVWVKGKEVVSSVAIHRGLKDVVDAFKIDHRDIEEIDHAFIKEEIERGLEEKSSGRNKEVLEDLKKQIMRAWAYLSQKSDAAKEIEGIVFTGYAEYIKPFMSTLSEITLEEIAISPHLDYKSDQLVSYAIEIGLALDVLQVDKRTLQLREGKFFAAKQKNKLRKKVTSLFTASAAAFIFSFISIKGYQYKKNEVAKRTFKEIVKSAGGHMSEYPRMNRFFLSEEDVAVESAKLLLKAKQQKKQSHFLQSPNFASHLLSWVEGAFVPGATLEGFSFELTAAPSAQEPTKPFELFCKIEIGIDDGAAMDKIRDQLEQSLVGFSFAKDMEIKQKSGIYEVVCFLQEKD